MSGLQGSMLAASTPANQSTHVYTAAILLSTLSFIFVVLIIPSMIWHFRNRNTGATVLVAWITLLLLFNFVNAIIWGSDDVTSWFKGSGLCDFEVKIQVAAQIALPSSVACMLRALAAVMDTERVTLVQNQAQRQRTYVIDLSFCIGFPLVQMFLHYIVQTYRYNIYGISGCVPTVSNSWVSIVLMLVPPMLWTMVDAYYAILILIRLYRYRVSINNVLALSNTSKSRFVRLYALCILWIFGSVPVQTYVLYYNLVGQKIPFSWSETHDAERWSEVILVPSGGTVLYDRWIWLAVGIAVFAFFNLGTEAMNMHRTVLRAIAPRKFFSASRLDQGTSSTSAVGSYSSKLKMLLRRTTNGSSSASGSKAASSVDSTSSNATSVGPSSSSNMPDLEMIVEIPERVSPVNSSLTVSEASSETLSHQDPEKASSTNQKPSIISRISNMFRARRSQASTNVERILLSHFRKT